jgi:hypothetical protein
LDDPLVDEDDDSGISRPLQDVADVPPAQAGSSLYEVWGVGEPPPNQPRQPEHVWLYSYAPVLFTAQAASLVRHMFVCALAMQQADFGEAQGNWDPHVLVYMRRAVLFEAVQRRRFGPLLVTVAFHLLRHGMTLPTATGPFPVLELAYSFVSSRYDSGARLPAAVDSGPALQLRLLLGLVPLLTPHKTAEERVEAAACYVRKQIEAQVSCTPLAELQVTVFGGVVVLRNGMMLG